MNKTIIKNILEKIDCVNFIGNINALVDNIVQITKKQDINSFSLCWSDDDNLNRVYSMNAGTYIVSEKIDVSLLNSSCNYIIVKNPRRMFQTVLSLFFVEFPEFKISKTANIHHSVKLGDEIFIGENVVIEKDCIIGNNTRIGHNTVIFSKTIIGNNVYIGSNNTIGGVGFGYEKNDSGEFELIPHIGGVIIEDNVEIGNNTCIDRAVLGNTHLHRNVKVDNLVHVAHGVIVGENSVIIANAMIGGSTTIGSNVWVAPSASLINKIQIADNSLIGISANVVKNVNEYEVVAGNPAKVIKTLTPKL